MPTGLDRLQRWLREQHVAYALQHHRPAYTVADMAVLVHEPAEQVAKVVVGYVGERLVLLVVPASAHVDFERVAALLDAPAVRVAHEDEFADRFPDCEVGAMPPFGSRYGLPTYLDEALARSSRLVFQAGTHRDTIRLATEDYLRLEQPVVAVLTRPVAHFELAAA